MGRLLRVNYNDLNYDIELEELKRYHVDSIMKSNREHFGIERECTEKASRATEALFFRDDYILNWLDCKILSNSPPPVLNEAVSRLRADWVQLEKRIIRRSAQKA